MLSKMWKRISTYDEEFDNMRHKRNDEFHKVISGFAEIRSNCTEKVHYNKIYGMNALMMKLTNDKVNYNAFISAAINMIWLVNIIITIIFGLYSVSKGTPVAIAISLVMYSEKLISPLISLLNIFSDLSEYKSAWNKYHEFMQIEPQIRDGKIVLTEFNNSITIKSLEFEYNTSETVLKDVNLTIHKGKKIGICGYSGGGKSTLMKLLPRFYDATSGSIYIDGIDIKDFTVNSLRSKFGIVHQSNYIFKGTIKDNIVYGAKRHIEDSEIVEAARKANIYDFIITLPDGFNTDVGPNGLKLSGGQQQRIAIARIFLQNPDIILFDEATSALDNESEAIIKDSMKLFADKTIITIAHRLTTIQGSDKIVVINDHSVAEIGTHDDLMKNNDSLYYKLYTASK